jgi:hypothetical protein
MPRIVPVVCLVAIAACGAPEEPASPEPAAWPETVFVRHLERITRVDGGGSIRLEAVSVFDDVQVFEYEEGGPLLVVGVLKMHDVKKVTPLGGSRVGTVYALDIEDPALILHVSTDGTVETPRPVERPKTGGVYSGKGDGLPLRVRFLEDGRALAVVSDESPHRVGGWIEEPGRAHASPVRQDGAAIRFEMPPVDGESAEFVGVVTPFGIVTARPRGLPERLRHHETGGFGDR